MLVFRKVTIDQFVTIEVRDEHGVWHNMTSIIDELEAAKVGG
jgi:hypothetical protein